MRRIEIDKIQLNAAPIDELNQHEKYRTQWQQQTRINKLKNEYKIEICARCAVCFWCIFCLYFFFSVAVDILLCVLVLFSKLHIHNVAALLYFICFLLFKWDDRTNVCLRLCFGHAYVCWRIWYEPINAVIQFQFMQTRSSNPIKLN